MLDRNNPPQPVYWIGSRPDACDCCYRPVDYFFVDGRTRFGPWAIMCSDCEPRVGTGVGEGRGQRFERQSDGRYLKTA